MAAGRPEQVQQHPNRRRLAGSVRAHVPKYLAGVDLQIQPVNAQMLPVVLGQRFQANHGLHLTPLPVDGSGPISDTLRLI